MLQETLSHLSQSWRLWLKISYESEKIETCFPVGSHFLRHYGVFFSPWKALIITILAVPESRKLTRPPLRKWVLIFDIILKAGHRNLPDCVDWLQKPWHTNIAKRFRLIHSDGEIKEEMNDACLCATRFRQPHLSTPGHRWSLCRTDRTSGGSVCFSAPPPALWPVQ